LYEAVDAGGNRFSDSHQALQNNVSIVMRPAIVWASADQPIKTNLGIGKFPAP